MSFLNYDSVLTQLQAAGLIVGDLIVDERFHACRTTDGGKGKKGWYKLWQHRIDKGFVITGAYGNWRDGVDDSGKARSYTIKLTGFVDDPEERAVLMKRSAEARRASEKKRADEAARAAAKAQHYWAMMGTDGWCQYLTRKGLTQLHGARASQQGNLVVPMTDTGGRIHGLQIIYGDNETITKKGRDKDFWPQGLDYQGTFHLIGQPGPIIGIAEGFATGASVHEATGLPVAVAYTAGNLKAVADVIHKRYRDSRILILADDDAIQTCAECGEKTHVATELCEQCGKPHRKGNAGLRAASIAALAVHGAYVYPVFENRGLRKLTDFNDLAQATGLASVRAQIEAKIQESGWNAPPRGKPAAQGGGELRDLTPFGSVDELLRRFSLIYGHSGTVFDHDEHMMLPLSDMRDACNNRMIHRQWAESQARKIVRIQEVGFDPSGRDGQIKCNLWGGWPTKPAPGKCDTLLELLFYLCSAEDKPQEVYEWVLKWLAYPIQHPGAKMRTALILHGPQGTGKNLFFEAIMAIYGQYGRIVDQAAIEDKFNDWASKKLFLIADEVVARAELYHVKNKLKHFVTGEWIRINPKNIGAYDEKNHVNIVFLSNETQPLVLERDDRRYTVIWTPENLPPRFYSDVGEEIDAGGIEALHDHLLHLDLGDFNPHTKPPSTKAKVDLIELGMNSIERFWLTWTGGKLDDVAVCPAPGDALYELYRRWSSAAGISRYAPEHLFSAELAKRRDTKKTRERCYVGSTIRQKTCFFPPNAEVPPAANRMAWITEQFEDFTKTAQAWAEKR